MNIRLFAPNNHKTTDLPDEMLLYILQYLSANELLAVSETYNEGYRLSNDNLVWMHRYQRDFGLPVTAKEAKAQYIAATLFERANNTPRADLAQLIYSQLFNFLYRHAGQEWTLYYMGYMYYEGKGRPMDQSNSLVYLRISATKGNPKAICCLIDILKNQINVDTQTTILQELGAPLCNKFLCLLEQSYHQGYKPAAPIIAYLYDKAKNNRCQAIKWYETALAEGCVYAIPELIGLQNIDEAHTYIDNLIQQYAAQPEITGELLYQKAQLYYDIGDDISGLNILVKASPYGNIAANKDVGNILRRMAEGDDIPLQARIDSLQKAIECFRLGTQAFDSACTEGLFYCLMDLHEYEASSYETTITHFKELYAAGNSFATILISKHYALDFNPLNPAHISWLQCAAQTNIVDSYYELINLSEHPTPSPFVFCALGILAQFGVLHSSFAERDTELAKQYFECAHELDNTALSTYLDTMKAEGNANNEIVALLQNEINLRANNQRCQSSCRG